MVISAIILELERWAPLSLQESYDNAGLITGDANEECTGIMVSLDATEAVIEEAAAKGCNLLVSHHPIVFSGLKKFSGDSYLERALLASIRLRVAIYAIHTNLDNVVTGVNASMAERIGLQNIRILLPKSDTLSKLYTFVPEAALEKVRQALFEAGAGEIGAYDHCSFGVVGTGTFRAGEGTDPYVGKIGEEHREAEVKLEVVVPDANRAAVVAALNRSHPYEEVAYDLMRLSNPHPEVGSGVIGELASEVSGTDFLKLLKDQFGLSVVRYTGLQSRLIRKVAICGGAGSFLIKNALRAGADAFVTSDVKYHEFFDAENRMMLADIGHFESEQFIIDLLAAVLRQKFITFATLKTTVTTNPVQYFVG